MLRTLILFALLTILTAAAEETARAQKYELLDGRTAIAVRAIRIYTPKKTTYLITLPDGRKWTFTDEDVANISDVDVSKTLLPPSLNVEKKPEPEVVVEKKPEAPLYPPKEGPITYVEPPDTVYYDNTPRRPHRPNPPPVSSSPPPRTELTASERARQAFSTIPSFEGRVNQTRNKQ